MASSLDRVTPKLKRVPPVRVAKVTWDKPSAQELHCLSREDDKDYSFPLLYEVKCLVF